MNGLRTIRIERSIACALPAYSKRLFMLCLWTLLLCLIIWFTNPISNVRAQGECILDCQQGLMQCLQLNTAECQNKYDDCVDSCLGQ